MKIDTWVTTTAHQSTENLPRAFAPVARQRTRVWLPYALIAEQSYKVILISESFPPRELPNSPALLLNYKVLPISHLPEQHQENMRGWSSEEGAFSPGPHDAALKRKLEDRNYIACNQAHAYTLGVGRWNRSHLVQKHASTPVFETQKKYSENSYGH